MRVAIRNYQIIERAELEIRGLTVIVGPSHSGKSALIRAIESGLYNARGRDFIRVGMTFVEVDLVLNFQGSDHTWIWSKDRTAYLNYDGNLHSKIGSSSLEEFLHEVGFKEVRSGEDIFRPHFQRQLTSLFATSEKPTTLFNLLLSFAEFDRLPHIRKTIDQDLRSLSIGKKAADLGIVRIESSLVGIKRFNHGLNHDVITEFIRLSGISGLLLDIERDIEESEVIRPAISDLDDLVKEAEFTREYYTKVLRLAEKEIQSAPVVRKLIGDLVESGEKWKLVEDIVEEAELLKRDVDSSIVLSVAIEDIENLNGSLISILDQITISTGVFDSDTDKFRIVNEELGEIDRCTECGAPVYYGVYDDIK